MQPLPPNAECADEPVPTDPAKLFEWMCTQNLPQLEDEQSIQSYDELETADNESYSQRYEMRLLSPDAHQLHSPVAQPMWIQIELRQHVKNVTTYADGQTQTNVSLMEGHYPLPLPPQTPLPAGLGQRRPFRWWLLKALMVFFSALILCYVLGINIYQYAFVTPPPSRSLPAVILSLLNWWEDI